MAIIIILLAIALIFIILMVVYPDSTILNYIVNWKYRLLFHIRKDYLFGLKCNPPTGYDFFFSRALEVINNVFNIKKPLIEREDIVNMLKCEGYIHYYFTGYKDFTISVYRQMWDDYRSGVYATKNYTSLEKLLKILPLEISTNERAFNDFMKFVDAGWFDASTGMFLLGGKRNLQHIGRAIWKICKRNSIPSPEKVFSTLWEGYEPKTIKEWLRTNQNETITEQIDNMVKEILSQK